MVRILLLILVIVTIWALWRAFGPNSARRQAGQIDAPPRAIGPDDDEDFLWNIKKERFKAQREAEREAERRKRNQRRDDKDTDS